MKKLSILDVWQGPGYTCRRFTGHYLNLCMQPEYKGEYRTISTYCLQEGRKLLLLIFLTSDPARKTSAPFKTSSFAPFSSMEIKALN